METPQQKAFERLACADRQTITHFAISPRIVATPARCAWHAGCNCVSQA
ncbi:hypothetical protein PLANPX_5390 [Lacipirellula parvula]|uniref:Uncharacterized protein n=1 Tax=Lacipirellula parvula TaxID=2650471 RepID=A0A5K7XH64_9BACT|nr:hypothetical protein PLANPX_5390 [Lacipirellula parvula]